uniref:Uncharacterized protein n=1 Tax=Rhipicephalus pulchellus TaxID=72859 RepID=L7LV14_RHIPC
MVGSSENCALIFILVHFVCILSVRLLQEMLKTFERGLFICLFRCTVAYVDVVMLSLLLLQELSVSSRSCRNNLQWGGIEKVGEVSFL